MVRANAGGSLIILWTFVNVGWVTTAFRCTVDPGKFFRIKDVADTIPRNSKHLTNCDTILQRASRELFRGNGILHS